MGSEAGDAELHGIVRDIVARRYSNIELAAFITAGCTEHFGLDEVVALTRAMIDGQISYYDHQLQPAFAARFDWGWPFKDGVAEVCQGCSPGKPDPDGHTAIEGGKHFRIDRHGKALP